MHVDLSTIDPGFSPLLSLTVFIGDVSMFHFATLKARALVQAGLFPIENHHKLLHEPKQGVVCVVKIHTLFTPLFKNLAMELL